jgi:hypothetical protein
MSIHLRIEEAGCKQGHIQPGQRFRRRNHHHSRLSSRISQPSSSFYCWMCVLGLVSPYRGLVSQRAEYLSLVAAYFSLVVEHLEDLNEPRCVRGTKIFTKIFQI